MIITHKQVLDNSDMLKESISFMLRHGRPNRYGGTPEMEHNGTKIQFTYNQIILFHDELRVGHVTLMRDINVFIARAKCRMSAPTHYNYICFTTPADDNNKGRIISRMDSNNTSDFIDLVPKCSKDDWDSTAFQLSTMYDDKTVSALLLEPYINDELECMLPEYNFRYKLYTISDNWNDFQFDLMTKNIKDMYSQLCEK